MKTYTNRELLETMALEYFEATHFLSDREYVNAVLIEIENLVKNVFQLDYNELEKYVWNREESFGFPHSVVVQRDRRYDGTNKPTFTENEILEAITQEYYDVKYDTPYTDLSHNRILSLEQLIIRVFNLDFDDFINRFRELERERGVRK